MKLSFPHAVFAAALLAVGVSLIPPRNPGAFDLAAFGALPVLADGRMKPLDTIARTSLLMFQGRQRLAAPDGRALIPEEWLLEVVFRPQTADTYPAFRIDNPDLLSLFGLGSDNGVSSIRFSFAQLQSGQRELDRQAQLAETVDASARSAFQRAAIELREHVAYFDRLKYSFQAPDSADFYADVTDPARFSAGRPGFEAMDTFSLLRAIPPGLTPGASSAQWQSVGHILRSTGPGENVDAHARMFAALGRAWRTSQPEDFNALVHAYRTELSQSFGPTARRCAFEAFFNRAEPFYTCLVLYVLAFLLAVISWLKWRESLGAAAFLLTGLAFALATAGILARMWLEGRPPVTNLYSSALFIGWGAVALCLILERIHRNALAVAAGAFIGFGTLVIAHNLALSGDTLEMMRAVLDSNFWLSTHVVTVTTGYASTFLAGFLAIIYILRGLFTRSLDRTTADSLARMVYGIVCFATFFSFVGTVLGGIWADQSWGRFWGWDPKENGALIIVLWNSVILHCRWGGLVKPRGLMALAVFGNIVTAWSWFGVNMLGIGLHSYGFTNAAFYGLTVFVCSQLVLIALAGIPLARWRSFKPAGPV
jgi:ABC-type transport system involved in cytochrome c biogenesis permease subunit